MKTLNIMKVAVAIALLFAVNMEADAQFGKLKNLAKKAKEAVIDNSGTSNPVSNAVEADDDNNGSSASNNDSSGRRPGETEEQYKRRSMREFHKNNPAKLEQMDIEDAGSYANYFGVTAGSDSALVCYIVDTKYEDLKPEYKNDCFTKAVPPCKRIIEFWRHCKNPEGYSRFNPEVGGNSSRSNFKSVFIGYNDHGRQVNLESELKAQPRQSADRFDFTKKYPKEYKIISGFYKQCVATYESMYGSLANVKSNDQ